MVGSTSDRAAHIHGTICVSKATTFAVLGVVVNHSLHKTDLTSLLEHIGDDVSCRTYLQRTQSTLSLNILSSLGHGSKGIARQFRLLCVTHHCVTYISGLSL